MPERLTTPFLARRAYRLRRMMDAARLLPVLGALAFLVPVLTAGDHPQNPMWYGRGLGLLLGMWLVLVVASWLIGRRLRPAIGIPDEPVSLDEADDDAAHVAVAGEMTEDRLQATPERDAVGAHRDSGPDVGRRDAL